MERLCERGTKICSNGSGHMTKMAAMPIYGKNLKKSSSPEPKGRWDGTTNVCSNGPGHMTKMAAMSIYVISLKIFISGTKRPITLNLGMQYRMLEYYQVCSNDDPGLTLTYFTARSNLVPYAFVGEKGKTMDFSETIVVYDNKVGRYC